MEEIMTDRTTGEMEMHDKTELQDEGTREGRYFRPPVDIFEDGDEMTIVADVPGVSPENFEINLHENTLTITAARDDFDASEWEPVYDEFREGHFLREFRLGKDINQSKISAKAKHGVLTLHLPKAKQAKRRKIEVNTA
jgi:HSP20 family protein